jgi:hypothetical protein
VDRASSLQPITITVKNDSVKSLFLQAHEAFLYGFDTASVALCRSLVEHALKDNLSPGCGENRQLGSLIERADREKLLVGVELECAKRVNSAGNNVMHNLPNLRKTAQEVLDCSRIVLDKLYGDRSDGTQSVDME